MQSLTCHGLEQVCTVLHVVVAVVVVCSLAQSSALLVRFKILIYCHFEVFAGQLERVVAVVALCQQELCLRRECEDSQGNRIGSGSFEIIFRPKFNLTCYNSSNKAEVEETDYLGPVLL